MTVSDQVEILTKKELEARLYASFKDGVKRGEYSALHPTCHGGRDGDCTWWLCPQLQAGEPEKSGRHCPLDKWEDDE